jgi:5-methylcytosine-specific restriction protein A
MPTPTAARSIDALIAEDPGALDNAGLKLNLVDFAIARARLDAAEAATIAEFDQRAVFVDDGMVNTRSWLAQHTGIARQVAGGRILTAKRLRHMPIMAKALAEGTVTNGHAVALGRGLKPRLLEAFLRDEAMLVEQAARLEVDDFQQVVSRWIELNDIDGPDPGDEKPSELHTSPLLDGRTRIDGELDLEDSADYLAELEAIYDELWHADQAADLTDPDKYRTPAQRRAAAQVDMARRSSAAGDRDADPVDETAARKPRPRRPQLIVIVDVDALAGDLTGEAHLDNGVNVPLTVLERWACDSAIGRVVMQGRSLPVDVGTITYTATNGQRRALTARDRGCIVPGCKRKPRWCQAHHVVPWQQEGPTNLNNLVLLCKRHHKHLHAHHINIERDNHTDQWIVTRPDGTPLRQRPPPATLAA